MTDTFQIGLIATFFAGTVSFLSPCVLPLVPGYISYVAGHSMQGASAPISPRARLRTIGLSVCFVLGFSTVFVILGASATALGRLLLAYRYELNIVGGAIVVAFGLLALGLLRPAWLLRDLRIRAAPTRGSAVAAYVLGAAFAFGWSPCIGPILGTILTVGAGAATVERGMALLAVYSLGLGLPFLVAAAFTGRLLRRLKSTGRIGRACHMAAGSVMIVMGAAMITGQLTVFSYWLLDTFPLLSKIG